MIWYFIIGFFFYTIAVSICYIDAIKYSSWYFPIGLLIAVICNFLWLSVAKPISDSSRLLLLGIYWDVMLTAAYTFVPILLFKARFGMTQALGLMLVFCGLVLIKV